MILTGTPIQNISIHAPPRGATTRTATSGRPEYFNSRPSARGDKYQTTTEEIYLHFNSRPSARGDYGYGQKRCYDVLFQFTPLREGRLRYIHYCYLHIYYFNSRPSARGDVLYIGRVPCPCDFNSRPSARGDSYKLDNAADEEAISIHAPPRGATCPDRSPRRGQEFQFTPLREGRLQGILL